MHKQIKDFPFLVLGEKKLKELHCPFQGYIIMKSNVKKKKNLHFCTSLQKVAWQWTDSEIISLPTADKKDEISLVIKYVSSQAVEQIRRCNLERCGKTCDQTL